jgi:hypothetical protein
LSDPAGSVRRFHGVRATRDAWVHV